MPRFPYKAGLILALCALGGGAAAAQQAEASGDPKRGAKLFRVCLPCHEIGRGANHRTGPVLNGLFGRSAGAAEGYASSTSMVFAGLRGVVWTDETLTEYLKNPRRFAPGSEMPLVGVANARNRRDLIAFLHEASEEGTAFYESFGPANHPGEKKFGEPEPKPGYLP